jgi:hypothetical protein
MANLVPSQAQIMGQLRTIIPPLGTVVSALGVSGSTANYYVDLAMSLVGPISYLIVAVWSLAANSRSSIMAEAAKPVSAGVAPPQIVLPASEQALADQLPSNVNTTETKKVVSAS